jgi:uncharacterized protein (UPF0264 family)
MQTFATFPYKGPSGPPALLVSVRDPSEAEAALRGGCSILDVKEPSHGPLGMATPDQIARIVRTRNQSGSTTPVSVALGELIDWDSAGSIPPLPEGIAFLKVGTARLAGPADFAPRCANLQIRFSQGAGKRSPAWVAVAYADWNEARCPSPFSLVTSAASAGCQGLLIDTCSKKKRGLLECLSFDELRDVANAARASGLWFALAGRLSLTEVERVALLAPDVVGIRSAACTNGNRNGPIDAEAVRRFRGALDAAWWNTRAQGRHRVD